jgi:hypothetical protein
MGKTMGKPWENVRKTWRKSCKDEVLNHDNFCIQPSNFGEYNDLTHDILEEMTGKPGTVANWQTDFCIEVPTVPSLTDAGAI